MFDLSPFEYWRDHTPGTVLGIDVHNTFLLSLVKALIVVLTVFQLVPVMIWYERRLLSWMQDRIGPNRTGTITFGGNFPVKALRGKRVGTFGLFQILADGVKGFTKEQLKPGQVDSLVYVIAPALSMFPAFLLSGTLPWGPQTGAYGVMTPIANLDFGILYVLAASSLSAYGVVLGGYASNNKYSLMGGLRASAQLLSYELAMGMAAAAIVLASGSLKLTDIVRAQEGNLWGFVSGVQNWFIFTPFGILSAVIFFVCMLAETNRVPFDLPEAENELIAGYMTEYSSKGFLLFAMAEYIAMFTFSCVFSCLYLGGYNLMPFQWGVMEHSPLAVAIPALGWAFRLMGVLNYWLAPLGIIAKGAAGITLYIWVRATLPRLRYDQLMKLGWQTLLPVGVANLVVVGLWIVATSLFGAIGGWAALVVAMVVLSVLFLNLAAVTKSNVQESERRSVTMTDTGSRRTLKLVGNKESKS